MAWRPLLLVIVHGLVAVAVAQQAASSRLADASPVQQQQQQDAATLMPRVLVDPPRGMADEERLAEARRLYKEAARLHMNVLGVPQQQQPKKHPLATDQHDPKIGGVDHANAIPPRSAPHLNLLDRLLRAAAAAPPAKKPAKMGDGKKAPARPSHSRWDQHDPGYYTDDFARRFFMPLAAAAYADDPSECIGRKFRNASMTRRVLTDCEANNGHEMCAGFAGVSHSDRAIFIAFRGTQGFYELVLEIEHVVFKQKQPAPMGGLVAYYFHTVFDQLWAAGLRDEVEHLLRTYPDYEIWITGHSLGGAVASIAGTWILNEYALEDGRIKLITFGQPRTGDTAYAKAHNQRLPRSYRVTNKRDIVPHIPPERFEDYYHHGGEIWYPDGMRAGDRFLVCNDGESKECSDKQWLDISIHDHLNYFDGLLEKYADNGCRDE